MLVLFLTSWIVVLFFVQSLLGLNYLTLLDANKLLIAVVILDKIRGKSEVFQIKKLRDIFGISASPQKLTKPHNRAIKPVSQVYWYMSNFWNSIRLHIIFRKNDDEKFVSAEASKISRPSSADCVFKIIIIFLRCVFAEKKICHSHQFESQVQSLSDLCKRNTSKPLMSYDKVLGSYWLPFILPDIFNSSIYRYATTR